MNPRHIAMLALGAFLACGCWLAFAQTPKKGRQPADKALQEGQFKEAYMQYRQQALDPRADPKQVGHYLQQGVAALRKLGREDETDEFREAVIAVHKDNWRLLHAAARSYDQASHFGFIVAGQFERGGRRGGGKHVSSFARDRVRALQLMQQALPRTNADPDNAAVAGYLVDFARMLVSTGGQHEPWRLQYLTNLSELPDYEEQDHHFGRGIWGGPIQGAPVDADGNPIFHQLPKSYETAKSDGERWRWLLNRAAEVDPTRANEIRLQFANFLQSQFGVETMAQNGWLPRIQGDDDAHKEKSGTYALHTLTDDETIARLATGIKRLKLPGEFNFLKIFQEISRHKSPYGQQAADAVANIYLNRRQYSKAAAAWRQAIEIHGPGKENYRKQALDQIVGNWGRFENLHPQASGQNASLEYRFRNGKSVSFEAYAIKVSQLLADVKAYLRGNPNPLNWNQVNIGDLGHRLVIENQGQYLGDKVASWNLALKPRPDHVDDRVTVTTPLQKAGAYLLVAKMENGNTSRIIVWISDTVIAKKQLGLDDDALVHLREAGIVG